MTTDLGTLEEKMYNVKEGMKVLSVEDADKSTAIILSKEEIILTNKKTTSGINVSDSGITIQGETFFTSHGKSIRKGNYSENPDSVKLFTYPETVYVESLAKEAIYKAAGIVGIDVHKIIGDGFMPIITDVGAGPLPHIHSITTKHVHRIEPTYLYKIPGCIKAFKGFMSLFTSFLAA